MRLTENFGQGSSSSTASDEWPVQVTNGLVASAVKLFNRGCLTNRHIASEAKDYSSPDENEPTHSDEHLDTTVMSCRNIKPMGIGQNGHTANENGHGKQGKATACRQFSSPRRKDAPARGHGQSGCTALLTRAAQSNVNGGQQWAQARNVQQIQSEKASDSHCRRCTGQIDQSDHAIYDGTCFIQNDDEFVAETGHNEGTTGGNLNSDSSANNCRQGQSGGRSEACSKHVSASDNGNERDSTRETMNCDQQSNKPTPSSSNRTICTSQRRHIERHRTQSKAPAKFGDRFACELYQAVKSILPPPRDYIDSNAQPCPPHKQLPCPGKSPNSSQNGKALLLPPPPPPLRSSSLTSKTSSGKSTDSRSSCEHPTAGGNELCKDQQTNGQLVNGYGATQPTVTFSKEAPTVVGEICENQVFDSTSRSSDDAPITPKSIPNGMNEAAQCALEISTMLANFSQHSEENVNELQEILGKPAFKALLRSHDEVAMGILVDRQTTGARNCESGSHQWASIETQLDESEGKQRVVRLYKNGENPLGATVVQQGNKIVIGRIIKGGVAEKCGLLRHGDVLLDVNGIDLRKKSIHEVCDLLAAMRGELAFTVLPKRDDTSPYSSPPAAKHLRALFDYDPEDDYYLPCRELGLAFRKGDILHVISMADPNWWQAHKNGEDESTLPGLIPSANFQIQRECCRLQNGSDSGSAHRVTGAPRNCSADRTDHVRRVWLTSGGSDKRRSTSMFISDGYGVASICIDSNGRKRKRDSDLPDTLAYEEVTFYLPHSTRKRPIVLIAPAHSGHRHVIQKLMEMKSEKVAQVVYHTSRPRKPEEADGGRYYFLSRNQFQECISKRKFVEWGIYQRHFYGTTYDSIRRVIERRKTCILTLKPQSLKAVRIPELKPFIVFISPPPFERLKVNIQRESALLRKPPSKDHEILNIIAEATRIERKYGHYFDKTVINYDNDQTVKELLGYIQQLETEPQWCPMAWFKR